MSKGKLDVPDNFAITAPPHVPGQPERTTTQLNEYTNPQTEAFCALVGVENLWAASEEERAGEKAEGPAGYRVQACSRRRRRRRPWSGSRQGWPRTRLGGRGR